MTSSLSLNAIEFKLPLLFASTAGQGRDFPPSLPTVFGIGILHLCYNVHLEVAGGSYKLDQRWVKNNRDPENIVFGTAGREHDLFIYDDTAFLLSMAIADQALFGYETLADLQQQEIPAGENELILRFKESVFDKLILRKCTKAGGCHR
jgi:hypothetical protein